MQPKVTKYSGCQDMLHVSLRVMETHLDSCKPISQSISGAWKHYYLLLFHYYHEVIPAKASNTSWGHKSWNPNLNHKLNDLNVQESHEIYSTCLWNGRVGSPDLIIEASTPSHVAAKHLNRHLRKALEDFGALVGMRNWHSFEMWFLQNSSN